MPLLPPLLALISFSLLLPLRVLGILHTEGLTGILQCIPPEGALKIHMVTGPDGNIYGEMDKPVVHQPYQELGLASHGGMHSMGT